MSIERINERRRSSLAFITFTIALNIFIAFTIFRLRALLIASLVMLGISVFVKLLFTFVFTDNLKKSTNVRKSNRGPTKLDYINLARTFTWNNRRQVFAIVIGLFLALLIIAQSLLISATYQENAFQTYTKGDDISGFNLKFEHVDFSSYIEWNNELEQKLNTWFSGSQISYKQHYSEGNLKFKTLMGRSFYEFTSFAQYLDTETHVWNSYIRDIYSAFPSYPGDIISNDTVLVLPPLLSFTIPRLGTDYFDPSDFIDTNENGKYMEILAERVSKPNQGDITTDFHNITFQIDRVWQLTYEDLAYIQNQDLQIPSWMILNNLFFPNNTRIWELYGTLIESEITFNQSPYVWGDIGYSSAIYVQLPEFRSFSLEDIKQEYERITLVIVSQSNDYWNTLKPHIITESVILNTITPLLTLITNFLNGYENLEFLFLIFSTPLILVSLFLLYFSLNSIEKKKQKLFAQLVSRGASVSQLRIILIYEITILALISSLLAIFFAIPLSRLLLQSTDIFEFHKDPIDILIPDELFWRIPTIGFLLAFNFNLGHLNKLSLVQVEDNLELNEDTTPTWIKFNVDLILFSIILLFWGIIIFLPFPEDFKNMVFSTIGPTILIFTLIATPLIVGRYFLDFLSKFLVILKQSFDMFGIALNNLSSNKNFTGKLLTLITISLMITFSGLTMSYSMQATSESTALYTIGSEVVVEDVNFNNPELLDAMNVSGISSLTHMRYIEYYLNIYDVPINTKPSDFPNKFLYGIQPENFSDAAFWQSGFSPHSLDYLMTELAIKENGLILPRIHAEYLGLEIGDTFNFMYGPGGSMLYEFELIGIFDYFPRIIFETPKPDNEGEYEIPTIFMIMDLDTLNFLWQDRRAGSNDKESLITLIDVKIDPREVAATIRSNLLPLVEEGTSEVKDYLSESKPFFDFVSEDPGFAALESDISFVTLHSIFLFTIIIGITGMVFYSTVFLNGRKKEFGIYRALGMTKRQIAKIIYYELILLTLLSLVLGLLSSFIISYLTFKVILAGEGEVIPPFSLKFPLSLTSYIMGSFIIISLLVAFLPSRSFSKSQTGNILRVG